MTSRVDRPQVSLFGMGSNLKQRIFYIAFKIVLTCHDITHHGSMRLDLTSDLRSNFVLDLVRSTLVSFDPSRQEAHNGDQAVVLGPIGQQLVKHFVLKIGA